MLQRRKKTKIVGDKNKYIVCENVRSNVLDKKVTFLKYNMCQGY